MIDLSRVREVLADVTTLVEDLDGVELDETDAVTAPKNKTRQVRPQRSQELQLLATRFELAAAVTRVEYWYARGEVNPLAPDRDEPQEWLMHEIDDLASRLARHLSVFQMEVAHEVPAPILAAQAGIIARAANELEDLLRANPMARVSIDPQLNEGMEKAYLDALGISTDVPDFPPEEE